ncbi:TPA: hypothetical protein ACKRPO_005757 [Pseudomonas aeruginosa]|nr:hypothetical protein [Pseudomonas aeruginosa]
MTDATFIKSELRKALDSLMEMATDGELLVLSGMIDVQLRKAVFLRGAHQYGFDAEQLARFHQEFIVAREHEVAEDMEALDRQYACDLQASLTKH